MQLPLGFLQRRFCAELACQDESYYADVPARFEAES